jgi:hypothetical protein
MRPVCAAFWEADRVFTGRAEVTPLGPGAQRARFLVEESFRGPAGDVVEIVGRGIGGSCAYAFGHGVRYLVYARRASDGTWRATFCDPIAPLDQAGEGLAFARAIARDGRRGGSLVGFVSIVERARDGQTDAASPASRATVTIRNGIRVFSAKADARGQYEFLDLNPGRYLVTVSVPLAVDPVPPATIEIKGAGACVVHHSTLQTTVR